MDLSRYTDHIKAKYAYAKHASPMLADLPDVRDTLIEEFNKSVKVFEGRKYLKVVVLGSAHSFVVKEDSGKFNAGDVLAPVSFKAPATNFKRGTIFDTSLAFASWACV